MKNPNRVTIRLVLDRELWEYLKFRANSNGLKPNGMVAKTIEHYARTTDDLGKLEAFKTIYKDGDNVAG